ncbi:MAG: 50S ribosomal protein L2 [Puniceicoccales bacterium]|jgi:large subunit ribosomal protein L2|nr:50S ribosomal protein L2 [Puniceicoccales bacterium]
MTIIQYNPKTPTQRFLALNRRKLWKGAPEETLLVSNHRCKGRNCYGRITSRRRGGGHKRLLRVIDFLRDKMNISAHVERIEYDPNRSADIALLNYVDGEKRYILAPRGLNIGDQVVSLDTTPRDFSVGMSLPLARIPMGVFVHCVEIEPGKGAAIARGAGVGAQIIAFDGGYVTMKMPSGEIRLLNEKCRATIGQVGNGDHSKQSLGKAGRKRWLGRRPRVRGVVMNPVDHPMGGGEGRTSGGGHPVSPWGQLAKGYPTRKRSQPSNRMILVRRNGRKVKKG